LVDEGRGRTWPDVQIRDGRVEKQHNAHGTRTLAGNDTCVASDVGTGDDEVWRTTKELASQVLKTMLDARDAA